MKYKFESKWDISCLSKLKKEIVLYEKGKHYHLENTQNDILGGKKTL